LTTLGMAWYNERSSKDERLTDENKDTTCVYIAK